LNFLCLGRTFGISVTTRESLIVLGGTKTKNRRFFTPAKNLNEYKGFQKVLPHLSQWIVDSDYYRLFFDETENKSKRCKEDLQDAAKWFRWKVLEF